MREPLKLNNKNSHITTDYFVMDSKVINTKIVKIASFKNDYNHRSQFYTNPTINYDERLKWAMEHACQIWSDAYVDPHTFDYMIVYRARLIDSDYTFFLLKWGTK